MTGAGRLRIEPGDRVVVGHVSGEIDVANAAAFGRRLWEAVPNGAAGLVVDLSEVTYLDSAGIRLVFDLRERLASRSQRVHVVAPRAAAIRRVLTLVGLDAQLPFHATASEAVAALEGEAQ